MISRSKTLAQDFIQSSASVDYFGTLTAALIGAAGETALLARAYGLSTSSILTSLTFLTGLNYYAGKAANYVATKASGCGATLFSGVTIQGIHLGDTGYEVTLRADERHLTNKIK